VAEEIEETLGVEAEIRDGELESFNVFVNGECIFSFQEEGRFPRIGEIPDRIQKSQKSGILDKGDT